MTKLYIFDKDGTLTTPKSGNKFVQHPEDQQLIPGTIELLTRLKDDGSAIVIASNQGGIAAGYKSQQATIEEMRFCMNLLPQIKAAYFCPDFEGRRCVRIFALIKAVYELEDGRNYRKPGAGMLLEAIEDWNLAGIDGAFMIGDRPEDEGAAEAAGIAFQWIWNVNPQYSDHLL